MDLHEHADLFADRAVGQAVGQVMQQFDQTPAQELGVGGL